MTYIRLTIPVLTSLFCNQQTVAEKEEKSTSIPWFPLITLIGVSSGALLFFSQLTSSRPGGGDQRLASNTFDDQTVDARLWQDPLGVIVADPEKDQKKPDIHSVRHFQELLIKKCFTKSEICMLSAICPLKEEFRFAKQWQILAVMIPGGPYVEDVERRIRSRRAVIEGLGVAEYGPEKDDEIGYFYVPWRPLEPDVATCVSALEDSRESDERAIYSIRKRILGPVIDSIRLDRSGSDARSLLVPYEWYEPAAFGTKKTTAKHVLVLWLTDAAFRDAPLARLADLISWFRLKLSSSVGNGVPLPLPRLTLLGPDNSGTLRKMVLEAKAHPWNEETLRFLATTHVYSSQAAAAESRLLSGIPADSGSRTCQNFIEQKVKLPGSGSGFWFDRTILLDDEIVKTLWQELDLRDIKRGDHIAIISEEDTFYARALSSSFLHPDPDTTVNNVYSYSYLRGIDGKLPSDEKDEKETKGAGANGAKNTHSSLRPTEQTEGLSQADDLRRLAEMLQNVDTSLRDKGGQGIKAVGLLGSDVYDKLELLKALRPVFPEAVFFTNNLDARLAHPDEWKETHNLVVASAHDLSLKEQLKTSFQKVAPFRDSGQTALFEATLEAMGKFRIEDAKPKSPLIFEIGRSGAKELSVPTRPKMPNQGASSVIAGALPNLFQFSCFVTFGSFFLALKAIAELFRIVGGDLPQLLRPGCFIVVASLLIAWIHLVTRVTPESLKPETKEGGRDPMLRKGPRHGQPVEAI
jgi:hypothetical protein